MDGDINPFTHHDNGNNKVTIEILNIFPQLNQFYRWDKIYELGDGRNAGPDACPPWPAYKNQLVFRKQQPESFSRTRSRRLVRNKNESLFR